MIGCQRLEPPRLAALLTGTLDAAARRDLADHLEAGACEACLQRIEDLDSDHLLAALAGPVAQLSAAESDALFAAVVAAVPASAAVSSAALPPSVSMAAWSSSPPVPSTPPSVHRVRSASTPPPTSNPASSHRRSSSPPASMRRPWLAAATLALAAGVAVVLLAPREGPLPDDVLRPKSATAVLDVTLEGVVGRRGEGAPVIDRRFARSGHVEAGESVLFRYRLSRPAHLTLVIDRGTGGEVAWSSPPGALDGEVAHDGRALSLDATRIGGRAAVWLIASSQPLRTATTAPGAAPRCDGCAIASLEITR